MTIRRCKICRLDKPKMQEIEAMLRTNTTFSQIMGRFPEIKSWNLSRHKSHMVQAEPTDDLATTKGHLEQLIEKLRQSSQTQLKSLMDASYDADAVKALAEDLLRAATRPGEQGAILPFDFLIKRIVQYVEDVRSGRLSVQELDKELSQPLEKIESPIDMREVRDDVQRASQYLETILKTHAITVRFWNRTAKSRGDLTELLNKIDMALTSTTSGEVYRTDLKGLVLDLAKNQEAISNSWRLQLLLKLAGSTKLLYGYQRQIIDCPDKTKAVLKCVQTGLSWLASCYSFLRACLTPNILVLITSKSLPQAVYVLAKSKTELLGPLTMRSPFRLGSKLYSFWMKPHGDLKTSLTFWNGSQVLSVPSSSESYVGYEATVAIGDEFAMHKDQHRVFGVLCGRVAKTKGDIWVISTPRGPRGKFAEIIRDSLDMVTRQPKPGASIRGFWISKEMCPHLDPAWIESKRKEMGETQYLQDFEGSFLEGLEIVIPYALIVDHCTAEYDLLEPPKFVKQGFLSMGCDIGFSGDSSVVSIYENINGFWHLRYIYEFKRLLTTELVNELSALVDLWRPDKVIIDSTGNGLSVFHLLQEKHSQVEEFHIGTSKKRNDLIINSEKLFAGHRVRLPPPSDDATEKTITQISLFRRGHTETGQLRFDSDQGHDDHALSSFLALWAGAEVAEESGGYDITSFDWVIDDKPRQPEEPEDLESENGEDEGQETQEPLTTPCPRCSHDVPYRKEDQGKILVCSSCGKPFRF